MLSIRTIALTGVCFGLVSLPAAAADLKLEIRDGRVTLVATDVPARQILTEWARLGQTKIVNADKLPGTPLTLQLEDVPEAKALEIVLRNTSGHIAVPRSAAMTGSSVYDRIIIMPPSTAVVASNGMSPSPRPISPPTQLFRPPMGDAVDDQDPPVPMPQPGAFNPGGMPTSALTPGMPGYVPPPSIAPPGSIPPYPGAPMNIPNMQPQPQSPGNPWGVSTPGATTPGSISPMPQPTQPGVINPLVPRRPGGQLPPNISQLPPNISQL
jgi:hypothetical protein